MGNWRIYRYALMTIAVASAALFFNLGASAGISSNTEVLSGITLASIAGVANLISLYALYKEL